MHPCSAHRNTHLAVALLRFWVEVEAGRARCWQRILGTTRHVCGSRCANVSSGIALCERIPTSGASFDCHAGVLPAVTPKFPAFLSRTRHTRAHPRAFMQSQFHTPNSDSTAMGTLGRVAGPSGTMPPPPAPAGKSAALEREANALSSCFKASTSSTVFEWYSSFRIERGRKDWSDLWLPY